MTSIIFTCQQHLHTSVWVLPLTVIKNLSLISVSSVKSLTIKEKQREEHSCVYMLTASPSRHKEAPRPYRVKSNRVELLLCSGKAPLLTKHLQ